MSARDVKRAVHDYMAEVLHVPASLSTTIDVLIDEGSYAEAERRLARLARMRNTSYFPPPMVRITRLARVGRWLTHKTPWTPSRRTSVPAATFRGGGE